MAKKRKDYEESLNQLYYADETLNLTEHCWAGNDKTQKEKNHAKKLARQNLYGTILRKYDPVAFNTGFNDWVRN